MHELAVTAGHRLEHVAEIGSTSAELVARAANGERGPLWLVADTQVSGRGRNARNWSSPAGNLYASVLLTDPARPAHVAELSFVLSLALRDAVLAAAGLHKHDGLRLKWPNDLLADGAKTAGLLLEGGQARGAAFVVAGFGVNLVSHPRETPYPAIHLRACGLDITRDRLLAELSSAVVRRMDQWKAGAGFDATRRDWLACAHGVGAPMRVTTLNESFEAVFEGIDENGRLLAATANGVRAVSAGDVFPLEGEPA